MLIVEKKLYNEFIKKKIIIVIKHFKNELRVRIKQVKINQ